MGLWLDSVLLEFVIVFISLAGLLLWYYKTAFSYWEKQGIATVAPSFPAGNIGSSILQKEHIGSILKNIYNETKSKGPISGIYLFNQPGLIVNDPEQIKNVLVRNFKSFYNRGLFYNEKKDPLSNNLFFMEDEKWKTLRDKITPTFSSGKLKQMFPLMQGCCQKVKEHLDNCLLKGNEVEIRDVMYRFTVDVIATCVFGIESNALQNSDSEFHTNVKNLLKSSFTKSVIYNAFKSVSRKFGGTVFPSETTEFFFGIVKETIEYREANNVVRNDFMQLMIDLKNNGIAQNGKDGNNSSNFKNGELSVTDITAQAIIFFVAGFESSASTISFCLYEFSINREVQDKARKEVKEVLKKYGGAITYEALQEMKYLDQCINEVWRKYPTLAVLNRECTESFKLPGTSFVIPKGMPILIPVQGLHHDPDYYPDPDRFDPDRFTDENKAKRHSYAFLPFGEGPRYCVGMRFGITVVRIGLVTALMNYDLERSDKSPKKFKMSPTNFSTISVTGIYVKVNSL